MTTLSKKSVQVTHTYTPYTGFYQMVGKSPASLDQITFHHRDRTTDGKDEIKSFRDFKITPDQEKAILKLFPAGKELHPVVREVRYVLSTGANWKGPIQKFRLEIKPANPCSIVLCSLDIPLQKNNQGVYVIEETNFTPTQDLRVLFIGPELF